MDAGSMGGSVAFTLSHSEIPSRPSAQDLSSTGGAEDKAVLFHQHTLVRVHRQVVAKAAAGVCPRCWHAPTVCVCGSLHHITLARPNNFHILMHPSELFNAGNSARLLLSTCSEVTSLYIYGLAGDEGRLCAMLSQAQRAQQRVVVMFPSPDAVTAEQLKASTLGREAAVEETSGLHVILLDGTWSQVCHLALSLALPSHVWRQARTMRKHLARVASQTCGADWVPVEVQLQPSSLEYWSRERSGKSVFKRGGRRKEKEQECDRICTLEALALLLLELGEPEQVCSDLIHVVEINNQSLCRTLDPRRKKAGTWDSEGFKPYAGAYGESIQQNGL